MDSQHSAKNSQLCLVQSQRLAASATNRLFYTLQNPAPRFVVADNKMVAGQDERAGLICPDKTRLQTPLNVMNDDILRSIYSVCPKVSDISCKCRFRLFGSALFIASP